MRKTLLVLLLGAAVAGCGDGSSETISTEAANPVVRVGDADADQQRRLLVGQRLVVALPANPSTGYSWSIARIDSSVVKQDGAADYEPDSAEPVAPGAGGTAVWNFVGVAAGVTTLQMEYARPWDQGLTPARTFSLTIEVR
ncbi:protease inhibitor I42 family protein [Nocardia barduliensis]|uniref:protease inhibitor I42 family protein n=1 Tax=Nocardia barduliensis TaxID=2736643 RepID=UPI001572F09B|nr:protease inhibitor I42 family protein [Nocardia barduliensis]